MALIEPSTRGDPESPLRWTTRSVRNLAAETGLEIAVCHFPPGTSKWNKIEHRLFSAITMNWRGKPLVSHETVVNLIAATTTRTGPDRGRLAVRLPGSSGRLRSRPRLPAG